jgi:hypothetical protein
VTALFRLAPALPNPSFKGEAQRRGTLAIKCRAYGPFCPCCPVRQAAGLPLNSNVRRHTQALRFACISIQMQLSAAAGSIQIMVPSFCGIDQGRGQANHSSRHHRSAHVLRRSRVPPSLCPQPKHSENLPLAIHVAANSSQTAQAIWSRLKASQRKAVSHEVGCGLFRLFVRCRKGRAVVGARQAKFWWQPVAFPVQLRNATKECSAA